ncbi:MAG: amidohydrolase [Novosphingobium sp.]|nr:amidohydrolase [Novosphingobium sp.]
MRLLLLLLAIVISTPVRAETIAITNARLMDGDRDEPGMTIVLKDERILSVSRGGPIPSGARIVDAAGRPVTPSLAAAATQIGIVGIGSAEDTRDEAVTSGPAGAGFDISRAVDANDLTIQEARAQGLASAMIYPDAGNGVFAGKGAMLHLVPGRDPVSMADAAMFAAPSGKKAGGSRAAAWTLIRNGLTEARRPASPANGPRDDLLDPLDIEALRPVAAGRIPLAITANRESDIRQAIALAKDYGIRVVVVGGAEAWRVASALASSRIPVIIDPLDDLPFSYDAVGARRDNAAILAKAGVPIAFMVSAQGIYLSYDVGPALREGAGIAVANGLSRGEALRAITTAPSQVWTGRPPSGLVAGAAADLVVWDGDPLEPSSAPSRVFIAGREVSPVTRQTLLRDRYHPSRSGDALPPAYR